MKKRILTLLIEVQDVYDAAWIWDSHSLAETCNGINILAIAEGDQTKELNDEDEE